MGKERTTNNTTNNQTQKVEPTPEERRFNQLQLQQLEATNPLQIQTQTAGLNLVNKLLTGEEPLPGFFDQLSKGIDPNVTNDIVAKSINDIRPSFQSSGILDSGVAASISGRIAGDIRRATEEYNLGNKFNLLNLALSGQAQVQQPLLGVGNVLAGSLAGLRTINSSGSGSQTTIGMNPFLKSFQTSFGSSLGETFGSLKFAKTPKGGG